MVHLFSKVYSLIEVSTVGGQDQFNRIASTQSFTLPSGDPPFLAQDNTIMIWVSPVCWCPLYPHVGFLWGLVAEDTDLFELFTPRVIIGIAGITRAPTTKASECFSGTTTFL